MLSADLAVSVEGPYFESTDRSWAERWQSVSVPF
jgi:hypothetical protein